MPHTLQTYLHALTHLKRGGTRYGIAPHKPMLVLTLMELVEKGIVTNNRFEANADLVGHFLENWQLLVATPHQADFTQPFYYLQSDKANGAPFWYLVPKPGCTINAHIKSVNTLAEVLDHGELRVDLFALIQDSVSRTVLQTALLGTYFPDRKAYFLAAKHSGEGYLHEVEAYILQEPESKYKTVHIDTEEEVFVRNGLFKRHIIQLYQSTCAFTGMCLVSRHGHSFVDACHIVPFSVSHDDRIGNGIALCPNMHRAFDRGLLSIDKDYRIIVSPHFTEDETHEYSIRKLKGRRINGPQSTRYFPQLDKLNWHREHIFKA
ncbi:HNH endonuclease [Parapedobacter tibetensis]|uniref:HNH endonuclease n=1 Tax=Parapedobacter tibetensis TaxID=2972951 RepID=UPI00214D5337|nr:HNH endonuclease [Parapedobacter tibetensis]